MEKITQTTYTMSEFVKLVKEAYKRIATYAMCTGVSVKYPSDPRCQYRLCVFTDVDNIPEPEPGKAVYGGMFDANRVRDMRDLFQDQSIIMVQWHLKPDEYVTIVRNTTENEEKTNE